MKSKPSLAAAMLLVIPSLAFARPKDSANVELDQPVTVDGAHIAPGNYTVTWNGSGPATTVRFAENNKAVATIPATVVNNPNSEQAILTTTDGDGTVVLQAIDLKKVTIQFGNAGTSTGN